MSEKPMYDPDDDQAHLGTRGPIDPDDDQAEVPPPKKPSFTSSVVPPAPEKQNDYHTEPVAGTPGRSVVSQCIEELGNMVELLNANGGHKATRRLKQAIEVLQHNG